MARDVISIYIVAPQKALENNFFNLKPRKENESFLPLILMSTMWLQANGYEKKTCFEFWNLTLNALIGNASHFMINIDMPTL